MTQKHEPSLSEVIGEAVDLLARFVVPLYFHDRYNRPIQFGSGFFVRKDDKHFLISAGHVLDKTRSMSVFYYAAPSLLRKLNGRVVTTGHPDSRDADRLDVGVMELTGPGQPPYPDVQKFSMDYSYLKPGYLPRFGKHYVIVGFPASRSAVDTRNRTALVAPYAYRSNSVDQSVYASQSLDPASHVVLPLDRRRGIDASGRTVNFPKPQGMSGAPIMVLFEDSEVEARDRVFPVVAVGTHYRKTSKSLIGTDVKFVIGAIDQLSRSGAA